MDLPRFEASPLGVVQASHQAFARHQANQATTVSHDHKVCDKSGASYNKDARCQDNFQGEFQLLGSSHCNLPKEEWQVVYLCGFQKIECNHFLMIGRETKPFRLDSIEGGAKFEPHHLNLLKREG